MPSRWLSVSVPQSVQAFLLAIFGHVQHSPARQIVDQGEVFLTLAEGLLVPSQPGDVLALPPLQPALDGPLHDAVNLIPAQTQRFGYGLLAAGSQPGDRQGLKQTR